MSVSCPDFVLISELEVDAVWLDRLVQPIRVADIRVAGTDQFGVMPVGGYLDAEMLLQVEVSARVVAVIMRINDELQVSGINACFPD